MGDTVTVQLTDATTAVLVGTDTVEVVVAEAQTTIVATGTVGPQGPTGAIARRHDAVGAASYFGTAVLDSLDADAVWRITRIVVAANGTTTVTHATDVAWDDRLTAEYV